MTLLGGLFEAREKRFIKEQHKHPGRRLIFLVLRFLSWKDLFSLRIISKTWRINCFLLLQDDLSLGRELFPVPCSFSLPRFPSSHSVPPSFPPYFPFVYTNRIISPLALGGRYPPCSCPNVVVAGECSCLSCPCLQRMKGRSTTLSPSSFDLSFPFPLPLFECQPLCSCPPSCPLRFRSYYPSSFLPVEVFQTTGGEGEGGEGRGWGVRATVRIKKGTYVGDYLGELISEEEGKKRGRRKGRPQGRGNYVYTVSEAFSVRRGDEKREMEKEREDEGVHLKRRRREDNLQGKKKEKKRKIDSRSSSSCLISSSSPPSPSCSPPSSPSSPSSPPSSPLSSSITYKTTIDARILGSFTRFINHSCSPNLTVHPIRRSSFVPFLSLFSKRDIEQGEELTFSYFGEAKRSEGREGWEGETIPGDLKCKCKSKDCIGFLPFFLE